MSNRTMFVVAKATEGPAIIEGIFDTEEEAIAACEKEECIFEAKVNERFPTKAIDAIKIYFPHLEKWEDSAVYKMRHQS